MTTMRERFVKVASEALESNQRVAVVLAGISVDAFGPAKARHPDRVLNVGIREQAMIGVAAGLALEGMRPVVHTFAPFLVERPFESLKIDLAHQGLGAVLVSIGASHDVPAYGRTHECPEDVALLDTLRAWTVHVPGHPEEAATHLRAALAHEGLVYLRLSEASNRAPVAAGPAMTVLRRGSRGTVVAVGPMLDAVFEAVEDLDVTVLYATTVRPFDATTLRATLSEPAVVVVEPYLAATSLPNVSRALCDIAHRSCGLGVGEADGGVDLHRYGTRAEHDAAHGLDPEGLRARITRFLDGTPDGSRDDNSA